MGSLSDLVEAVVSIPAEIVTGVIKGVENTVDAVEDIGS